MTLATFQSWILQSAAELTVLLVLVWMFDRFAVLRVRPQVRQWIWLVVLARLLLPPEILWPTAGAAFELAVPIDAPVPARAALVLWAAMAVAILAVWIVRSALATSQLRKIESDDPALARIGTLSARVAIDPDAAMPYVTGLFRTRLVLPANWRQWREDFLAHAVAHELTHIRRRDLWIEAFWMLAAALYWFHPLVHVARKRAYETREMCCDLETARHIGPAYSRSMLQLVSSSTNPPPIAMSHAWHPAVTRLLALKRWQATQTRSSRATALAIAVLVAAIALPGHWRLTSVLDIAARTRQELGLGSLHVRYLLMQQSQTQTK